MADLLSYKYRTYQYILNKLPGWLFSGIPGLFTSGDADSNRKPLLVHVHLPKNGGATLQRIIDKSFGIRHLKMYTLDPRQHHDPQAIAEKISTLPFVDAISSHSFRQYPEYIFNRTALYVCFLRNPVERHLSYFRYCKMKWDELATEHKLLLPADFNDMSLSEYFQWLHEQDQKNGTSGSLQVRYFSPSGNLDEAMSIISNFLLVGVTERMAESLHVLNNRLGQHGVILDTSEVPNVNTSRDYDRYTSKEEYDSHVIQYMESLEDDLKLFEWANDRLDLEIASPGHD